MIAVTARRVFAYTSVLAGSKTADSYISGNIRPLTFGHLTFAPGVVLFERVVIAVSIGTHKNPMFTLDERVAMARAAAEMPTLSEPFEGLYDYAPRRGR